MRNWVLSLIGSMLFCFGVYLAIVGIASWAARHRELFTTVVSWLMMGVCVVMVASFIKSILDD